jgi:hypothetical protein
MRWKWIAVGACLVLMWILCWAASVIPGSPAANGQWAVGNALAFLSGLAFASARRGT